MKRATSKIELEAAQDCYADTPNTWDRYGRLLAFVWRGGQMLNEQHLRAGHAEVKYIMETDPHYGRLQAARRAATPPA